MAQHHVFENIDAELQKRIIEMHGRRMETRRRADADAEVGGLHLRAMELIEVEVLAAASAVVREILFTRGLADRIRDLSRKVVVVPAGRADGIADELPLRAVGCRLWKMVKKSRLTFMILTKRQSRTTARSIIGIGACCIVRGR